MRFISLLLCAFLLSAQGPIIGTRGIIPVISSSAPVARVGTVAVGSNTTGSTFSSFATTTASITLTSGNAAVICARVSQPTQTFSFSDSVGNTYTALTPVSDGNSSLACGYSLNVTGGSNVTFTASWTPTLSAFVAVIAHQYSGVLSSSALDANRTASGASSTTQTVTAVTTTTNNQGVMCFDSVESLSIVYSAGSLGGSAMSFGGTTGGLAASEDIILSSTVSSASATMTTNSGSGWEMACVSLKGH